MAVITEMASRQGLPQRNNDQLSSGDVMVQPMQAMQPLMGGMGGMGSLPQMQNMNMMAQMPQTFSRMGAPQGAPQGGLARPAVMPNMSDGMNMSDGRQGAPPWANQVRQNIGAAQQGTQGDMSAQMAERMKRYQAAGGGSGLPMQQQKQNMQAQMGGMGSQGFGNMQGQLARTQEAMTGSPFGNAMPSQMGQFMNQMGQGAPMQNPYMSTDQVLRSAPMQNRMGNMFNQMGQMPSTSWNMGGPMGQAFMGTQNRYSYWPQGQMQNQMQQMGGRFNGMGPMQAMNYFGGW